MPWVRCPSCDQRVLVQLGKEGTCQCGQRLDEHGRVLTAAGTVHVDPLLPTLDRPGRYLSIEDAVVISGFGYDLRVGATHHVRIREFVQISDRETHTAVDLRPDELISVKAHGPGKLQSGGGFMGGGFGLDGALTGMAVASALNLLTTRTSVLTYLSLVTTHGELHFATSQAAPVELDLALAPIRSRVRLARAAKDEDQFELRPADE